MSSRPLMRRGGCPSSRASSRRYPLNAPAKPRSTPRAVAAAAVVRPCLRLLTTVTEAMRWTLAGESSSSDWARCLSHPDSCATLCISTSSCLESSTACVSSIRSVGVPRGGVASLLETSFPARGWSGCARARRTGANIRTDHRPAPPGGGGSPPRAPEPDGGTATPRPRPNRALIERQAGRARPCTAL